MMIKSALITSPYDVLDTGISDATRIFRRRAGHVKPHRPPTRPGFDFCRRTLHSRPGPFVNSLILQSIFDWHDICY